jgi:lipoprotein-anchoring transpeptidase ErfK/SrfK
MTITKFAVLLSLAALRAAAEDSTALSSQRIVVSIPDRKLALFDGDRLVKVYDIAVGKPSTPSPTGRYEIVNRVENPVWFNRGKPVPPGKANPLGTRWLGLNAPGYGIHGTNAPRSIGKAASHGCIRMRNRDVEELFSLVRVGAAVDLETETPQWLALTAAAD